jgi:hypothetical protein
VEAATIFFSAKRMARLGALVLPFVSAGAFAADCRVATVTSRRPLVLRERPSERSRAVAELRKGARQAVELEGEWAKVVAGEHAGLYLFARYLRVSPGSCLVVAVTDPKGVRVRARPSLRGRVVAGIFPPRAVAVGEAGGGWFRVAAGRLRGAYVSRDALLAAAAGAPREAAPAEQAPAETASPAPEGGKEERLPPAGAYGAAARLSFAFHLAEPTGSVGSAVDGGFEAAAAYESAPLGWRAFGASSWRFRGELAWLELSRDPKMLRFVRPQAGLRAYFGRFFAGLLYGAGVVTAQGARSRGSALSQGLDLRSGYELRWGSFFLAPRAHGQLVLDRSRPAVVWGAGLEAGWEL